MSKENKSYPVMLLHDYRMPDAHKVWQNQSIDRAMILVDGFSFKDFLTYEEEINIYVQDSKYIRLSVHATTGNKSGKSGKWNWKDQSRANRVLHFFGPNDKWVLVKGLSGYKPQNYI